MKRPRLFLIDASSYCYRAFFALPPLSNSKGMPTNAVYGFVMMLRKLLADETPEYVAAAFDLPHPTFRHQAFEQYKIHRKPMPDELSEQIPVIKELLHAYRIPLFEQAGFEADDILATVARQVKDRLDCYLVTPDKDALQLVGPHVKVYRTHPDAFVYDEAKVKEKYGVTPRQIVDLLTLCGDATDNIPGVPGVGEKTAQHLLETYGSVDAILKRADAVEAKFKRVKIREHHEQIALSRELATLEADVPIELEFDRLKRQPPDDAKLFALFQELEFRKLLLELEPPPSEVAVKVAEVRTDAELKALMAQLKGEVVFDVVLRGEALMDAQLLGVAIAASPDEAWYVDASRWRAEIPGLLSTAGVRIVGHNLKRLVFLAMREGWRLAPLAFDTMVGSYLLNPAKSSHELEAVALDELSVKAPVSGDVSGDTQLNSEAGPTELSCVSPELVEAAGRRATIVYQLFQRQQPDLQAKALFELFTTIELPLIEVLARMELVGVAIDREYLGELSRELARRLDKLTRRIYDSAGCEFNINSPKQLAAVLFERLRLPVVKRTKTGPSTDVEVLQKLAQQSELPRVLLEYRELAKLASTYVDALPELIHPNTQRVHTSYNQTVTATGRLSSSNPNLQNIPIKTEEGRRIRRAFVPGDPGRRLVSADYSQIELRLLAHLAGDSVLCEAFRCGEDIHRYTAHIVYGVKPEAVEPQMRQVAKTVNFGIVYGMSPFGLAQELGIPQEEARVFIDAYFARYQGVRAFLDRLIEEARQRGYATTLFNRRRYLPELNATNPTQRSFAERAAINAPIQGSAADIIKLAMIQIHQEILRKSLKAKMILQVHDELVFEVPEDELERLKRLVKETMERVVELRVPLVANLKVGPNWLDMQ